MRSELGVLKTSCCLFCSNVTETSASRKTTIVCQNSISTLIVPVMDALFCGLFVETDVESMSAKSCLGSPSLGTTRSCHNSLVEHDVDMKIIVINFRRRVLHNAIVRETWSTKLEGFSMHSLM